MTLTDREGYAFLAVVLLSLGVGFLTGRAVVALLAALSGAVFLGGTIASDDLYSRISEDVQFAVLGACLLATATGLVGVILRRIVDSERARRTGRAP